ncbi:hypothetical protein BH20ACT2_BH20ACT2_10890 [soil metagenome]
MRTEPRTLSSPPPAPGSTVTVGRFAAGAAAVASLAAAAVHLAVLPAHAEISAAHGVLFASAAGLQAAWAVGVVIRPARRVLVAGVALHAAIALAWLVSRTVGLPVPPDPWVPEPVGLADTVATGFALVAVAVAALLLRPEIAERRLPTRLATGLAAVGIVAVMGLAAPAAAAGADHVGRDHGNGGRADHGHRAGNVEAPAPDAHAPGAHDDDPSAPLDADTQAVLDDQLAEARAVIERHPAIAAAEAAGYVHFGRGRQGSPPPSSRSNVHFVDRSLVDADFDPAAPEAIMYEGTEPGGVATGVVYVVRSEAEPDGFAGPNDHWHRHQVCLHDRRMISGDLAAEECTAAGGAAPDLSDVWMLHVWVAPGYENPDGVFAHRHPDVNPPRPDRRSLTTQRRAAIRERLAELSPAERAEAIERFRSRAAERDGG